MEFTYQDRLFRITWEHDQKGTKFACKGTMCTIDEYIETPEITYYNNIVSVFAALYYKDKFDKLTGRKASLQKAIKDFPKELRTQIWNKFHAQWPVTTNPVTYLNTPSTLVSAK